MGKYVVFVDESIVGGSVAMALPGSGEGIPRTAEATLPTVTQILEARRGVLETFAAAMLDDANAPGVMAASAAAEVMTNYAASVSAGETMVAPSLAPPGGVQILEGVSAIIVDDDQVDVASISNVYGLTVLPNFEVELTNPVALADAGPANSWHLENIGLEPGAAGGRDILIGVLDTGIDPDHAEFAGKTIHFAEFNAIGQQISNNARDAGDHGTHVSSIAAGARAGVAPNADLAVAAVLTNRDAQGRMSGTLVQIVNGFNWLITTEFRQGQPGVDVINASLGGGGYNTYLQQLVLTALRIGIPLIAAIGNAGRFGEGNHGSPGNYPEVLSVGAIDRTNTVADFSDWGESAPPTGPKYPVPELCAPGVAVHAARPGGGFQAMSGTSMATPVVTGVAARRMADNPALIGLPQALFANLRSGISQYNKHPLGNSGGAGRIVA